MVVAIFENGPLEDDRLKVAAIVEGDGEWNFAQFKAAVAAQSNFDEGSLTLFYCGKQVYDEETTNLSDFLLENSSMLQVEVSAEGIAKREAADAEADQARKQALEEERRAQ